MLKELYIKNIAVIDDVRIDFTTGFHIFTGETGAGKSILVEAVGLVLGEKAKAPLIRDGASEAVVEAVFDVRDFPEVRAELKKADLENSDDADEVVIRRTIAADGKNKILINHQRSSLGFLQDLSQRLIDFTGQHQQIELLDNRYDIAVLDGFLKTPEIFAAYTTTYAGVKKLADDIAALTRDASVKEERLDWIGYQLKELNSLKIESAAAEAELKNQREELKHSDALAQFTALTDNALMNGDAACVQALQTIVREIERKDFLTERYGEFLPRLRDLKLQVEDLSYNMAKLGGSSGGFAQNFSLDEIESRLFQLEKLKRKFGPEITDVIAKRDELLDEKKRLENADEVLSDFKNKFIKIFAELKKGAAKITEARQKIAKDVEKAVQRELADLQMPAAQFVIQVEPIGKADDFSSYNIRGADVVTFLISPNPGIAPKPLAKIASGGETSRIFLAIKQVLTRFRKSGTLIFDEIDTGISGAAVELAGKKLKDLAGRFQVFCITHHAQIASLADRHFLVSKEITKGKTFTRVKILGDEERIREIARLMGGVKITQKNLEFAREMVLHQFKKVAPYPLT